MARYALGHGQQVSWGVVTRNFISDVIEFILIVILLLLQPNNSLTSFLKKKKTHYFVVQARSCNFYRKKNKSFFFFWEWNKQTNLRCRLIYALRCNLVGQGSGIPNTYPGSSHTDVDVLYVHKVLLITWIELFRELFCVLIVCF